MVYFIAESSDFNRTGWRVFYSVGNGRAAYFPELHASYDAALKALDALKVVTTR
jgi:hypothetical protein